MTYGADSHFSALIDRIESELLPGLSVASEHLHEPVVVHRLPKPWKLVGAGNYAVVVSHPDYPRLVIKIYAPGRPGLQEEAEVYRRLGRHPAYSECYHYGGNYLVLRRLEGVTLYDCVRRGIPIPRRVIEDIDEALAYASARGLRPHDVHGKNVMMKEGRGMVVDVSDFLKTDECRMWPDLKKAYDRFYLRVPLLHRIPVPDFVMNAVRRGYRAFKKRGEPR
ncbi:serine/threonine protein kinase [Paenibacillus sp. S-38]|uniref:serine/threonine protein kinase n=1 Tax=Paenibacillus sp. S-38 TaxID=3416710 RepID=UPI003CEF4882